MIWIPLALTSAFFLWHLIALASKGTEINRQMARLQKLQSDFEAKRLQDFDLPENSGIPNLAEALEGRKNFLVGRSKKREAKQRSLIRSRQLKERE